MTTKKRATVAPFVETVKVPMHPDLFEQVKAVAWERRTSIADLIRVEFDKFLANPTRYSKDKTPPSGSRGLNFKLPAGVWEDIRNEGYVQMLLTSHVTRLAIQRIIKENQK